MDNQTNPTTPEKQESKVPEPPALEIDIRTMESDIKAFKEGGGETPTTGVQEAFVSQRDEMQQTTAGAYTGPEKPLFQPSPVSTGPSIKPAPNMVKIILITAVGIIAVGGLGLLGYFVLFPQLFKLIGK